MPNLPSLPDTSGLELGFRFGHSLIEDFAGHHSPVDVLRELVQNEYDAHGSRMKVDFGDHELAVTGNGDRVDRKGWRRLSVTLGTGQVLDGSGSVEPKRDSIGSKNLGLRSLFTVGDRIWVFSGGRCTFLDQRKGSPAGPQADSTFGSPTGTLIRVAYRSRRQSTFEAFDAQMKRAWMDDILQTLTPTLLKLQLPGQKRGLRRVEVSGDGRRARWSQTATRIGALAGGIEVIERSVTERTTAGDRTHTGRLRELEFAGPFQIPPEFVDRAFASYYRRPRNSVRLAVSLAINGRGGVNLEPGALYYPLRAPSAFSGNAVSLSAPFELVADRSTVVSPTTSAWNDWLLARLAELTVKLLSADWFQRFGAGAYEALLAQQTVHDEAGIAAAYSQRVEGMLRDEPVWPSESRVRGKAVFRTANELVLPSLDVLRGFLRDERHLDEQLTANDEVADKALSFGVARFTPNSLIRLWCAGEDASELTTTMRSGESKGYFTSFPGRLRDMALQLKFARTLDSLGRRLQNSHRVDLRNAATVLASDGALRRPAELTAVPVEIWDACPVPLSERLERQLNESRELTKLCGWFDLEPWVLEVAKKTTSGEASEEEQRSLYGVIVDAKADFARATLTVLRKAPVMLDHSGAWAAPSQITVSSAKGATHVRAALRMPHRDYDKNTLIARRLQFRTEVLGADLLHLASLVLEQPDLAPRLEKALNANSARLKRAEWKALAEIPCLQSTLGGISAPADLYVDQPSVRTLLGPAVAYATAGHRDLHIRMGCRTLPSSEDVATLLHDPTLDQAARDRLYIALVDALRRERSPLRVHSDNKILMTSLGMVTPEQTLVGRGANDKFGDAVPCIPATRGEVIEALQSLGARVRNTKEDWASLMAAIARSAGGQPLSSKDKTRLLEAYAALSEGFPDGVSAPRTPFLLSADGVLHSLSEAKAGTLFINDFPRLAIELQGSVATLDSPNDDVLSFFRAVGVRSLRETGRQTGVRYEPDDETRQDLGDRLLKRLTTTWFQEALVRLVGRAIRSRGHRFDRQSLNSLLSGLTAIRPVKMVWKRYEIGKVEAEIPATYHAEGGTIYITARRNIRGLRDGVSRAIAEAASKRPDVAAQLEGTVHRLLQAQSWQEAQEVLEQHGIEWSPRSNVTDLDLEDTDEDDASPGGRQGIALDGLMEDFTSGTDRRPDGADPTQPPEPPKPTEPPADPGKPPKHPELPDITSVKPIEQDGRENFQFSERSGSGGGGGSPWRVPGPSDAEWESKVGRRGEELVYEQELKRLRAAGHASPEQLVKWISRDFPAADHDIETIDDDGQPLYIEVKSTTGGDGDFHWSRNEFFKAVRDGPQYCLCRVYFAGTRQPIIKRFRDPISLLGRKSMRVNLESLRAQLEPASSTP